MTGEFPRDGSSAPERIPWEARGELGLARAFARTFALSVRRPNHFYALLPRDASPWPAIAYGLVFEMIVTLASFAYDRTLGAEELGGALATIEPQLEAVYPGATALLEKAGVKRCHLTLSHDAGFAAAFVVLEGAGG